MKVKRIQKRQPLEKNRIKRLIKGTKLEVKRGKKKKKYHGNEDPNAYIDVKPVEFDPYDLRGRTTLKVLQKPTLNLYIFIDSSVYACFTWDATSPKTYP